MFNRRPKRIAGPGFHVNVRYDDQTMAAMRTGSGINKTASTECYDVKEMELLVCKKDQVMYNDGYTHCFTSLNGYQIKDTQTPLQDGDNENDKEEKILNEVLFVGVAVTEYIPSKSYSEQGFVSQIGGVVTLLNESNEVIMPGQKVQLGINFTHKRKVQRDKGIPREKLRFCIKPVKFDKLGKRKNVIGKALGYARSGDRVEVLLQPRHAY